MKKLFFVVLLLSNSLLKAQDEKPRLIVGIVVDQMRYDYIDKYWNKYGDGGFKRLVNEGFNCKNTHFNYVPTYTGPGHASIYTGTTPSIHGIIGNEWHDKNSGQIVYCVDDYDKATIGSSSNSGQKSPSKMLTTTIADELRMSNNKRSKNVSISLKDRGAVLPAGHASDAAFWYDGATGNWVSSSHYMNDLPKWVIDYNNSGNVKKYLSDSWNTLLDISYYQESAPDENGYEGLLEGETQPVFPHNLPEIFNSSKNWGIIKSTPFGNTITTELAIKAIEAEGLGKDGYPDLLTISFSSTDYIGHKYGPQSIEMEDAFLRLDKDIEQLLAALDKNAGKDNYVVFLTADHGAVSVPQQLIDNNIPAGYFDHHDLVERANQYLVHYYGEGNWVTAFSNFQIFLNEQLLKERKIMRHDMERVLAEFALTLNGVANAYTSSELINTGGEKMLSLFQKGYNQKRSGNVAIALEPGWVSYGHTGTTHGSSYSYDTHAPLLWFGKNIPQGKNTTREISITDIASTVSMILGISFPNGNTGTPIPEILK